MRLRYRLRPLAFMAIVILVVFVGIRLFRLSRTSQRRAAWAGEFVAGYKTNARERSLPPAQCARVIDKARALVSPSIHYESAYSKIGFPNGDVPEDRGVCADVLVRAFRADGRDLQALLNQDMRRAFETYPSLWALSGPDPNIDHRRVPNLMTWFTRNGAVLPMTANAADFQPCDVVAWDLGIGVTHIGLVSDRTIGGNPAIIHHIGGHPTEEDVVFKFRMIGHFAF